MASPDTADIRKFLTEFFNDDELIALCFDDFRDVYQGFAAGMAKGQKIQLLLEYCTQRGVLSDLLTALESERSEQYRQRLGALAAEARSEPVVPRPTVDTPTPKASQPSLSPAPQGTGDRMGKPRKVSYIGWVLILVVAVALGPNIWSAIAPTPRPTAEVIEVKLSTRTTPTLEIDPTLRSEKDGMVMVYVPAGEFLMGSADSDTSASSDEKPQHKVYLDAFWIDQTEVTNEMFAKFVKASGHKTDAEKSGQGWMLDLASKSIKKDWHLMPDADWQQPRGRESNLTGLDQHPVVQVSWDDAKAYCKWAGRRLPTEAEWEKAARWIDGRKYPWDNQSIAGNLLNFADRNLNVIEADKSVDDGYEFTAPVGSYPKGASRYGAWDMAGNVFEWVADWYDEASHKPTLVENPQKPTSQPTRRVFRGSAWTTESKDVRIAKRSSSQPFYGYVSVGFRCARSPLIPSPSPTVKPRFYSPAFCAETDFDDSTKRCTKPTHVFSYGIKRIFYTFVAEGMSVGTSFSWKWTMPTGTRTPEVREWDGTQWQGEVEWNYIGCDFQLRLDQCRVFDKGDYTLQMYIEGIPTDVNDTITIR